MTTTPATYSCCSSVRLLLDSAVAEQILVEDARIEWPEARRPGNVCVERAWPRRASGFSFEWSFDLGNGTRHSVFGVSDDTPASPHQPCAARPFLKSGHLRGLHVLLPSWGIRLQSPDRDPDLPHLAQCLDGEAVADSLASYWPDQAQNGRNCRFVDCRTLSYRPARRATIAYQPGDRDDATAKIIGKTFRDDRGLGLVALHADLNEQLVAATRGRVQTARPLGYLPEHRTVLFAWNESQPLRADLASLMSLAVASAPVLNALHDVRVEGLPGFSFADEIAVTQRWQRMLEIVDPVVAAKVARVLAALNKAAPSVRLSRLCTVHRDFYERQLLLGDDGTTILDLDTLAWGDPCLDVGNLLAHLCLAGLCVDASTQEISTLTQAVVRRYREGGGALNREVVTLYWASALFRIGAVHFQRSSTKQFTPALWDLARRLLACDRFDGDELVVNGRCARLDPEHTLEAVAP